MKLFNQSLPETVRQAFINRRSSIKHTATLANAASQEAVGASASENVDNAKASILHAKAANAWKETATMSNATAKDRANMRTLANWHAKKASEHNTLANSTTTDTLRSQVAKFLPQPTGYPTPVSVGSYWVQDFKVSDDGKPLEAIISGSGDNLFTATLTIVDDKVVGLGPMVPVTRKIEYVPNHKATAEKFLANCAKPMKELIELCKAIAERWNSP